MLVDRDAEAEGVLLIAICMFVLCALAGIGMIVSACAPLLHRNIGGGLPSLIGGVIVLFVLFLLLRWTFRRGQPVDPQVEDTSN